LEQVKAETSASKFLHKTKPHFYRFPETNSNHSQKFESIHQNENIGTIKLSKELVTNIEEVKITVSPVKIKKIQLSTTLLSESKT
jgi:hypothetical protein